MHVRDATPDDAALCAAIYAPYVTGSVITFESEPPDAGAMAERIAAAQVKHAWLVAERGYRTLVGGVTLPNDASVGLHVALGFEPVGPFRRIGWKLGEWRDVHYLVRHLGPDSDRPAEPR